MHTKKEIIGNIYLYIVVLIGLLMIVIPLVDLIKIGLETWFFPLATQEEYEAKIPEPYFTKTAIDPDDNSPVTTITLSEKERQMFEDWKRDYKNWQKREKNKNRAAIRKQRSMVRDISTFIVGLALFLSHAYMIKRLKK